MEYSIAELTTVEQCDAMLAVVALDRSSKSVEKNNVDKKHSVAVKDGPTIETDIVAANDNITGLEGMIAGMPEGPAKEARKAELDKVVLDLNMLLKTRANYGVLSKLKYEYNFNALEKSMQEIDVFIAAVNAKKALL
jgi:hypothetical protein